uniref:RNA-binding protein 48 n=1 Tax=Schistocephalus solidus TaxID=70667 RepID=A0A0X3Q1C2_SCHSO
MRGSIKCYTYHRKVGPCLTRPPYRDGKRKRAIKVFTIADESMYLLIFGVPSLGLEKQLKDKIKKICPLKSLEKVEHPDTERFTETFLTKFENVGAARRVRSALDDISFYGSLLHIVYAPEFETSAECRVKLHSFRRYNDVVFSRFEREKEQNIACQRSHDDESAKTTLNAEHPFQPEENNLPDGEAPTETTKVGTDNPYSRSVIDCQKLGYDILPLISGPSEGDALTESRRYWAALGYEFPTVFPLDQTNSRTGVHLQPAPSPSSLSRIKTTELRVPEAVLQALTCRPVTDFASSMVQHPRTTARPPQSSLPTPLSVPLATGFVPRSVQRKRQLDHRPVIRVGELKRLALMLGPAQGPCSRPTYEPLSRPLSPPNPSTSATSESPDSEPTQK